MTKYIRFELFERKAKTNVYSVMNISGDCFLGEIRWHPPWRQYCFFPHEGTVWNTDCLKDVEGFIRKLMDGR